jgi:PEP-CTERM motif
MKKKHQYTLMGALMLGALYSSTMPARAQIKAFTFPVLDATGGGQTTFGSIGLEFEVLDPLGITLTDYGAYDNAQNGFTNAVVLQMYSLTGNSYTASPLPPVDPTGSSGTAVGGTVSFAPGISGTLEGSTRFKPLASPFVILPGKYLIAMASSGELYSNDPTGSGVLTNSGAGALSFTGAVSRYDFAALPAYRNIAYDKTGPTFKFTPNTVTAPEPGTLALLGLGIMGFVTRRRRKN